MVGVTCPLFARVMAARNSITRDSHVTRFVTCKRKVTVLKTDAWETSVAHDFIGPYREPLTLKVKTHFA